MKLVSYFVRHGSTTLNDSGKFRGPIDVDLDEEGHNQAKKLASYFKNRDFSGVYTSSKKRTKQTADHILKNHKGIKHKAIKDFDALNVGDLAGEPKNEANIETMKHYQDNPEEKIPGGERLNDFRKRSDPNIKKVIKKGDESGKPTLNVVHSSIIHEVSHLLHGDHTKVKVKPGGVVGVFKTPNGYVAKPLIGKSKENEDKDIAS